MRMMSHILLAVQMANILGSRYYNDDYYREEEGRYYPRHPDHRLYDHRGYGHRGRPYDSHHSSRPYGGHHDVHHHGSYEEDDYYHRPHYHVHGNHKYDASHEYHPNPKHPYKPGYYDSYDHAHSYDGHKASAVPDHVGHSTIDLTDAYCDTKYDIVGFCDYRAAQLFSHPIASCFIQCDDFGNTFVRRCPKGTEWKGQWCQ